MLPVLLEPSHPVLLWSGICLCLIGMNLMTYLAFMLDKERARTGGWRVSERGLLVLAASGGWPAAKVAQYHLRHKRNKRAFVRRLNAVGTGLALAVLVGLTPVGAVLIA